MHAVLSVFATCSAVSCYVNMPFHHFLSPHPLDCASFTPSSNTFTDLSLLLREFHLHWEVASVIEPVGYNLEKKLWQIINLLSFRSEYFQGNVQLLFLLVFFQPQLIIFLSVFIPHWTSPLKYILLASTERLKMSVNKMILSRARTGFDRLTQVGSNMISQGIEYQKVDVILLPIESLTPLPKDI